MAVIWYPTQSMALGISFRTEAFVFVYRFRVSVRLLLHGILPFAHHIYQATRALASRSWSRNWHIVQCGASLTGLVWLVTRVSGRGLLLLHIGHGALGSGFGCVVLPGFYMQLHSV
jgi:hypothetical protein